MAGIGAIIDSADSTAKEVKSAAGAVKGAVNTAKLLANGNKSSLFRITKDNVFQFPIIMDADIDDDEKYPIIRAIERNYATLMMIAITNDGMIDRDNGKGVVDFLKKFHNNDIPSAILESQISSAILTEGTGRMTDGELLEMWERVEEQVDTSTINDMYLPYKRTAAKLTRVIEAATISALEASSGQTYSDTKVFKIPVNVKLPSNVKTISSPENGFVYVYVKENDDNNRNKFLNAGYLEKPYNEWMAEKDEAEAAAKQAEIQGEIEKGSKVIGKPTLVDIKKFDTLAPSILQLQLANTKTGSGVWPQTLILGIRAMPRFVSQSGMISNMIDAFQDRAIFTFIKWTNGEMKWSDFFFGKARKAATGKWLGVLKKRAVKASAARRFGKTVNPNATIIITESDAHMIAEKGGVDPRDPANVRKMMDKYFLLAFGIYDTDAKMLHIMYDGESEFTTQSLRMLIAESKKDVDLLNLTKF